jgi:hypothetical protein
MARKERFIHVCGSSVSDSLYYYSIKQCLLIVHTIARSGSNDECVASFCVAGRETRLELCT